MNKDLCRKMKNRVFWRRAKIDSPISLQKRMQQAKKVFELIRKIFKDD